MKYSVIYEYIIQKVRIFNRKKLQKYDNEFIEHQTFFQIKWLPWKSIIVIPFDSKCEFPQNQTLYI